LAVNPLKASLAGHFRESMAVSPGLRATEPVTHA
jgi:hypothetical protein